MNLRQGRTDWYRIVNKADAPAEVMIYDEIGYVGVTAQDFIKDLAAINGPIDLHLNTPGGEVFDGMAIYNYLAQRGGVTVYIDSLAASIGSVIAMAGDPVIIAKTGQMMIHDGFGMAIGNAADMRELADLLDKTSNNIAQVYADRTGKPAGEWRDLMRAETWFSAQETVDAGLADRIQGQQRADPRNDWDLSIFTSQPGAKKKNKTQKNASYDDSPWDGNAAMAGCSSAADFRAICAGEHSAGSPDERQHWALPHHKSPGAQPNRAGVDNALSRLPQTEDLTNRSAAEDHLKAHQKLWSDGTSNHGDWSPTDFLAAYEEAVK
jgi:ATP-dependent protease ClpP protease subunit